MNVRSWFLWMITGHLSVSCTLTWTVGTSEICLNPRSMNTTTVTEDFRLTTLQKEMLPFLTLWQEHTLQRSSLWELPRNKLGKRKIKKYFKKMHIWLIFHHLTQGFSIFADIISAQTWWMCWQCSGSLLWQTRSRYWPGDNSTARRRCKHAIFMHSRQYLFNYSFLSVQIENKLWFK